MVVFRPSSTITTTTSCFGTCGLFCETGRCSLEGNRESDAILQYIVDKYDKEHKVSVTDEDDKYRLLQWLFFQASGQG